MAKEINNSTPYKDFLTAIDSSIITLLQDQDLHASLLGFRFEGFSITAVFEQFRKIVSDRNMSPSEIAKDLTMLLGIFHIRGPNITKIKMDNTSGGEASNKIIQDLVKKYDITLRKSTSSSITLPRLSMVFPVQSYRVYTSLGMSVNSPIKETEIGSSNTQLFSNNFIPCFLNLDDLKSSPSDAIFCIYNIYQSHLSYRTRKTQHGSEVERTTRSPLENFDDATKYALLACSGSLVSQTAKTSFRNENADFITEATKSALTLFERFVSTVPLTMCQEMPTKFHILHNISFKKSTKVSELSNKNSNFEDLMAYYNSIA